jgi:DNA-binding beta-propeller fold protein YncE
MVTLLCALVALAAAAPDTLRAIVDTTAIVLPGAADGRAVSRPAGMARDAFGRWFISDEIGHRVMRFAPDGSWLGAEGSLGSDASQFRRPGAVALMGTLEIIVLDRENRRVVRYDHLGHLQGVLIDFTDATLDQLLGRVDPGDLATDRGGAIAIVDRDVDRLLLFDFSGNYLRTVGGFGDRPGSFRGLAGVAYTPRGDLVTTERTGARVQRLDPGGRPLNSWPIAVEPGHEALPVVVSEDDRIAVADPTGNRVMLFEPMGRRIASTTNVKGPRALAFAPDGSVWVAEADSARIVRVTFQPLPRDSARTE